MAQTKYTEGDWRISDSPKHPDSNGYAEIVAGDAGVYIADIIPIYSPRQYGPDAADIDFDLDDETTMANADLITAAPELLKAAKQSLALCKAFAWHETKEDWEAEKIVVEVLQAAIAKAEPLTTTNPKQEV